MEDKPSACLLAVLQGGEREQIEGERDAARNACYSFNVSLFPRAQLECNRAKSPVYCERAYGTRRASWAHFYFMAHRHVPVFPGTPDEPRERAQTCRFTTRDRTVTLLMVDDTNNVHGQ